MSEFLPYEMHNFFAVTSTNEEARRMAERGGAHGTVIWARSQTEGRGRYSRKWESPEGNLYLSILLRPQVDLVHFSQVSFLTALAARDAILKATGGQVQFKWPNDLLLNKKKCGGILLETSNFSEKKQWLVTGVGINIQFSPEVAMYEATSLQAEGHKVEIEALRDAFLVAFAEWYERWANNGFKQVHESWQKDAYGVGGTVTVRLPYDDITGIYEGIDSQGALLLKDEEGRKHTLMAGDVWFGQDKKI